MLNLVRSVIKSTNVRSIITAPSAISNAKLMEAPEVKFEESIHCPKPRECWIESLDTEDENFVGMMQLHPKIFASTPRIDLIHLNVQWQKDFRRVSFAHTKTRAEVRGGGRKPWPQKGLGKARHGSIRSPLWRGGGVAHGPRSPTTYFYMLPFYTRVLGLTTTLSVKLAQDDLHVVKDLEIPTDDKDYIKSLIEKRNWGPSVLFVDDTDFMPQNIAVATDTISYINLMPVYGLNVYSMLKYNTLVLTEAAVNRITERILFQFSRVDARSVTGKFKLNQRN